MFAIDRIPEGVLDILSATGVNTNDILLAAHADRTREHAVGDEYLFATGEELIVLHNGACVNDAPNLTRYPIKELRGISECRMLAIARRSLPFAHTSA